MVDVKKVSEPSRGLARYEITSYKTAIKKTDGLEVEVVDDRRRQQTTLERVEQEIARATTQKDYWEDIKAQIEVLETPKVEK